MNAPEPATRRAKRQPRKPKESPIPRRQNNGYYADHHTGDRLRSVTTILEGGVPKDALTHWYASTTATSAIENIPYLVHASRTEAGLADARNWLRNAPTRKKDERADVGSAVHKIIEAHVLEQPIPATIILGEGDRAVELAVDGPELGPFTQNFFRFVDDWRIRFVASEMVVANHHHGYAGTLDYILRSELIVAWLLDRGYVLADGPFDPAETDIMGDTKTGGTLDGETSAGHVHGVYPEAGLQMSAYRQGEVCWLRSGDRVPMIPTAPIGIVLHLRPEGYNLYPARCDDQVFSYFLHAMMVDEWTSKLASAKTPPPIERIIGPAMQPPRRKGTP